MNFRSKLCCNQTKVEHEKHQHTCFSVVAIVRSSLSPSQQSSFIAAVVHAPEGVWTFCFLYKTPKPGDQALVLPSGQKRKSSLCVD